ncbi:hypothetical protein VE01_07165 [Pseudogymnoascus verrucosus]|uniref:Uncharacterized protein n=1 Tax=Pseudogymnoascus verrucosus TaxID=342668 RepID=A0A1B8GE36_9PEZI|nr:uncharacterized protein VE01_07165 [Pseudogymnoascus verrucosus]OBT94087.1 hypothetical protein VE01_07165 [Pseudogymnoascus verrucosus]
MRDKSAAWSQLEASLHAEYQKASDSSSSQKAAIANLERRIREMTTEKNIITATGVEAVRNLDTAAAKNVFLVTYGESGTVASKLAVSIIEEHQARNDQLTHRRFQLHIIAAGAAGVVAAKAATKARPTERLATELAAHKDSSTGADAQYKALGSSHSEAFRIIEETRGALRLESGTSRALRPEVEFLTDEAQSQARREENLSQKHSRQIALHGATSWTVASADAEATATLGGLTPGKFISTRYDAESVALPKLSTSRIHKENMLPGEDHTSPHPVILTASAYKRTLPMVKASLILRGVDHDDSIMLQVEL